MRHRVKLFGAEAMALGRRTIEVDVPGPQTTPGLLRKAIAEAEPVLADHMEHCRFAVNHRFVDDDHPINAEDEVAIIGAVSGG